MAPNTVTTPAPTPRDWGGAGQEHGVRTIANAGQACELLECTRAGTLALVAHLEPDALEATHSPLMGPLVWDLAHIAAYEDLWLVHRHGRRSLLRPALADLYDAFETPRATRNEQPAGLLDSAGAYEYLAEVHDRACEVLEDLGPSDRTLLELVARHELQHQETMRQTMSLAGILPGGEPPPLAIGPGDDAGNEEWVAVAAGSFLMGAGPGGFAYDNERPRQEVRLDAFRIASRPLTNLDWQRFVEQGGYRHAGHWSREGWAWREGVDARAMRAHLDWLERAAAQSPEACL
ncbi:MAG: SUMF1/EgtB/PvdO family nonheme iron enzyme, partial [Solirubrobacteraceae bacterium]